MQRAFGARWSWIALAVVGLGFTAGSAQAIEFWDERVQVHGFYETRMSFGMENFNQGNGLDMYGWLQVLSIETEVEVAPDGWGPFDMIAAFARVEVKYDCVWTHACGMLPSVDAFGNKPGNLPNRVQTGHRPGLAGSQFIGDVRPYWFGDRQRLNGGLYQDTKAGQRAAKSLVYGSTNVGLFGASAGPDGVLGDISDVRNEKGLPNAFAYGTGFTDPTTMLDGDDDAGTYLFNRTSRCRVGNWVQKASNLDGRSNRELLWSPDKCRVDALGWYREIANPFSDSTSSFGGDVNPVLLAIDRDPTSPLFGLPLEGPGADGIPNSTALPYRPGAEFPALPGNKQDTAGGQEAWASQGLFVPNLKLRKAIRADRFDGFEQNYSLNELEWNRGASQQSTKELREIYLEFEAFESRLWMRVGKQTIVWGKTELFRNQDQWNPVDIAIGPLASLEESRIAEFAIRGIWSFYEVGPLEDVRLELVTRVDQFYSTDVGRCGEPYVPRAACTKTYGLWVHGQHGEGVAGEEHPPNPWDNAKGTDIGARLEFRWDRFSFALTDYYGYNQTPYTPLLFQYSRNVDPLTGRPRHTEATGPCTTGTVAEPDCLVPGMDPTPKPDDNGVVANHSVNQSLFAWICAGTVGVAPAIDASACAFTLFNSGPAPILFSLALGGFGTGAYNLLTGVPAASAPLVPMTATGGEIGSLLAPIALQAFLSPEQAATGGCGPFYQTDCDFTGLDLENMEASVWLQSFPWFEGTLFNSSWDTANASLPQPGTVDAAFNDGPGGGADAPFSKPGGLETGPAGTRFEDPDGNGPLKKQLMVLPGAHYDPAAFAGVLANAALNGITVDPYVLNNLAGYNAAQDGATGGAVQPFTGQLFSSEMAVASWNLLILAAGLGADDAPANRGVLDRTNLMALGRCSFRQPQYCSFVSGLAAQARNTNSSVKAGGNSAFGRRNFVWASIGDLTLKYQKRNILGFSTDFAEDTTKSSWGIEFTHVNDTIVADNSQSSGLSELDEFNLTVSVDRPTFINFLNANRTFFINSQVFVSYLSGYQKGMLRDGPWTTLVLVNANTGYFQDRFLVSTAGVYDFKSQSAALLPSVQYRFTENFSVTIGAAVLAGGWSRREMGINQFSATSDTNLNNNVYVENGISPVRDLDNFFLRLRYTY